MINKRLKTGLFTMFVGLCFIAVAIVFVLIDVKGSEAKARCTQKVEAHYAGREFLDEYYEKTNDWKRYYPVFEYEYQGVEYRETYNVSGPEVAKKIQETFPDGKGYVYINPNDPKEMYVESISNTVPKYAYVIAIIGAVIILLGLGIILDKEGKVIKA